MPRDGGTRPDRGAPQFEGNSRIEQRLPCNLWPTKYSEQLASQNAEYGISESLDFKIFPGEQGPWPPTLSWYYIPRKLWRIGPQNIFGPHDFSRRPCPSDNIFERWHDTIFPIHSVGLLILIFSWDREFNILIMTTHATVLFQSPSSHQTDDMSFQILHFKMTLFFGIWSIICFLNCRLAVGFSAIAAYHV